MTAQQSFSSTSYAALSGTGYTALSSSNFTAGKKYLIYVCATVAHSSAGTSDHFKIRTVHGSTAFEHSDFLLEPGAGGNRYGYSYRYFTVWTAVASEGVDIEVACSAATDTAYVDRAFVFFMNLSDDLTEGTDWEFSESLTETTVPSQSPTTHSSVTVDAASPNNGNWLVLAQCNIEPNTALADSYELFLKATGDVNGSIVTRREPERADNRLLFHRSRGYALTTNGNLFEAQINFDDTPTAGTCHMSAVFALNMAKFKASVIDETLGTFAFTTGITTPSYTKQILDFSLDPTLTTDVLCNAEYWADPQSGADHKGWYTRLRVGGSDKPSDSTSDGDIFQRTQDSGDAWAAAFSWLEESMTSGAKTIEIQGDEHEETVGGTSDCGERTGWAFTMELAAAGDTSDTEIRHVNQDVPMSSWRTKEVVSY